MRKSATLLLFVFLALAIPASSQEKSDKFAVFVTGLDDAAPVAQSLIKKMKVSMTFDPVTTEDSSKVVVLISCLPRKRSEPFVCRYVSHYNGETSKIFLGDGLYFSAIPDEVANDFLVAITSDIVDTCLLMTDSKCPDPVQKELGTKQLIHGQYHMDSTRQKATFR
jgi:hypothetical protein